MTEAKKDDQAKAATPSKAPAKSESKSSAKSDGPGLKIKDDDYTPRAVAEPAAEHEKSKPTGDSLGTPSGYALDKVGLPDEDDPLSDKERERGERYRVEKFKKRWLSN